MSKPVEAGYVTSHYKRPSRIQGQALMMYLSGKTYAEIAAAQGISTPGARNRVQVAQSKTPCYLFIDDDKHLDTLKVKVRNNLVYSTK